MMKSLQWGIAAVMIAVLAACGSPDSTPAATSPDGSLPEVLNFEVETASGDTFHGEQIHGTPTVMWFWASWCAVCNTEAPHLAEVAAALPDGVLLVGVPGVSSPAEDIDWFIDVHGLEGFPHIIDADGSLWSRFSVTSQPTLAFIDSTGGMTTITGHVSADEILERAAALN